MAAAGPRLAVGFGPETQSQALEARFPTELANRYPDARFDRAHNLVLDQLLTTGVLGLVALVGLIVVAVEVGRRTLGRPDSERALAGGLLGALVANLVAGLFAFDSIATTTLCWLVGGLLVAPALTTDERRVAPRDAGRATTAPPAGRQPSPRVRATAALAAGAIGLAALPGAASPLLADLFHTRALALRAGEAPAASIGEELAAVDWAPAQDVYLLALGETLQDLAGTTAARESDVPATLEDLAGGLPSGRDGLFAAARLALERAIDLSPADPYSHLHLARYWSRRAEVARDPAERNEHLVRAVDAYDRASALSPNRARFYDEAGLALVELGRTDEAIDRYRRAEALDRPTSERLARIADAFTMAGDWAGARSLYDRALALDPRSAPAERGLARLDRAAGDDEQAAERLRRATRYQMRIWVYQRDLAVVLRDLGRSSEALTAARAARRLAPAWEWDGLTALIESLREAG
jgi:tetratricopeptide (TPR) repeat protein